MLPLFRKEATLFQAVTEQITTEIPDTITSIVLYGSLVRGEERPFSDVDLLVLTTGSPHDVQKVFDEKNDAFIAQFGNVLSPLILSVAEARNRYRQGDALLREIMDTGRVIYGRTISEVMSIESQENTQ